ncbi:hypothetical protein GV794_16655 [Nocardia cyriacigeorgica]|uniref:Uncharacterized protein n=1 Tax=Nocardia cyriacigeorgica TaxID=135487 RepID=A0A6P1D3U5_9NOCA|nr:hypothetical protein [Nocardia cyriacigeorgica]NEW38638.1 hypothetical protein [Nocardia cyriacigeorgica]NEW45275.1 hypothetical protein [Nocardia cyriacigeorgica]NEW49661.1 hypothetical protein [Nocardia cyriacigeorgica]NEW57274.1 hypothetical protein [Nocardia cyriacigeorgica]
MANIASVFVRLSLRDSADEMTEQEVLDELLGSHGTYHVPVWSRRSDATIDAQFGVKWGAAGLAERLWAAWSAHLSTVWVRWYDDGGDFDDIEHRPIARSTREHSKYTYRGGTWIRRCRYRYDGIRITWRHEIPQAATLGGWLWRRDGSAVVADAAGDYLAGNPRCDLSDDPQLATPTTPTRGLFSFEGGLDHELYRWWREAGLPGSLSDDDLSLILSCGDRLELLWKGRPVMVLLPENSPGSWRVYSLDDWDNCADPDYLLTAG